MIHTFRIPKVEQASRVEEFFQRMGKNEKLCEIVIIFSANEEAFLFVTRPSLGSHGRPIIRNGKPVWLLLSLKSDDGWLIPCL